MSPITVFTSTHRNNDLRRKLIAVATRFVPAHSPNHDTYYCWVYSGLFTGHGLENGSSKV
ncbi:hypothetical protein HanRHA438_Chr07g0294421 [Helianthus annuus]|nr:hypothetical protein HanRHA438_Chr07g0294421 [Helianthus annuus]